MVMAAHWRDRVCTWRDNMRAALLSDAIQAPGSSSSFWLLYIPALIQKRFDPVAPSVICDLCKKCVAALTKRDKKGESALEKPFYGRVRGLWNGPEPQEIAALSYVERRVVQLARVYAVVKRVLGKHVPWARGNLAAIPQYTTRNAVAYPNDPSRLTPVVCLLPEDLCEDFAVQFVSSLEGAYQEPALQVSVERLRAAIWWLSTNCWQWMLATKDEHILSKDRLGTHLERIVSAYRESVGSSGVGVPAQLIHTATSIDPKHLPRAGEGPAEAVDHEAGREGGSYDSAVLDTGLEELTPLQLWSTAMSKYKVLEECSAILESLGSDDTSNAKEQALKLETRAIAEAAQALRRLASEESTRKLEQFANGIDRHDDAMSAQSPLPTVRRNVSADVKETLRGFVDNPSSKSLVMKIQHKQEFLNSFDENFWVYCFVDLFSGAIAARNGPNIRPRLEGGAGFAFF